MIRWLSFLLLLGVVTGAACSKGPSAGKADSKALPGDPAKFDPAAEAASLKAAGTPTGPVAPKK